jgi:hypothetical protein
MIDYHIAWWNVENLFDSASSSDRSERLRSRLRGELVGWTAAVRDRKIAQLASIIVQMNGGRGPDVLGVCEIESRPVLERLVAALGPLGRSYEIAHHDSMDGRGIDVAFIYDENVFAAEEQFFYVVLKRSTTRDLFQVNFRTREGRLLILIGNHWPARSGGRYQSEPYRIIAAETLSYWLSRIQDIHGRNANVLVMGDFNDEPGDRSLVEYALSTQSRTKVTRSISPRLFNLTFPLLGAGLGTHYFNNFPNMLDQILASRGLSRIGVDLRVEIDSAAIFRPTEMISSGIYESPLRFGRPSKRSTFDPNGYSDHFPISVTVRERS